MTFSNLLLLLLIATFFWIIKNSKDSEHLESVPYNSFLVPSNPIKTLYQEETLLLDSLLQTINKSTVPSTTNFSKYPSYLKFVHEPEFTNIIKEIMQKTLQTTDSYKNTRFDIIRNIYDLYYKDFDTSRYFVFNVDINNPDKAFSRRMKVFIIVDNIQKYLNDNGEYIDGLLFSTPDIRFQYIGTDDPINFMKVSPQQEPILGESNFLSYYRTKNTLFLLDPFLTNSTDNIITDAMKTNFETLLKEKQVQNKNKENNGFCYNSTNVTAKNKLECIDTGGTWDSPPSEDTECPFFFANQNYPNTFGSIKGDKCQLPRNMQIIGNRNYSYDPQYAPLCYNCKNKLIGNGSLGFCCDEQKNKIIYPNLQTPDYAFIGDQELRTKYKDTLQTLNLSSI